MIIKNAIICLRRDNDFNYEPIKDTFVPAHGEVCLVDCADGRLQMVCGDGATPFGQLPFLFNVVCTGYLFEGDFYDAPGFENVIPRDTEKLYIDKSSQSIYYFDGEGYQRVGSATGGNTASDTEAGVVKLYRELGQNEDGSMTQKAITNELNEKIEMRVDLDNEALNLSNNF